MKREKALVRKLFLASALIVISTFVTACSDDDKYNDKYVMVVDADLKAMIYKSRLVLSEWQPYVMDGFAFDEMMSFKEFSERFFVTHENPLYRLEVFPNSNADTSICRIYPRNVRSGKTFELYRGEKESRRYLLLDDEDDYLVFNCKKE